jgi:hypothetical protein
MPAESPSQPRPPCSMPPTCRRVPGLLPVGPVAVPRGQGHEQGTAGESRGIRAGLARPLTWSSRDFFVDMPFLLVPQFLRVRLGTGGLASYPYSALATATFRSGPTRPADAAP